MPTEITVQSIIKHNKKSCIALIVSLLTLISLHTDAISQEIVRSITVVTNNEVLETITVEDENGQPITGEVTATVDDTSFISVTPLENDNNAEKSTFLLKGISSGEATITFSVDDDSTIIQKEVNVTVVDIEPSFDIAVVAEDGNTSSSNTSLFSLPVVLEFTDTSGSNIVNREWSINNNVIAMNDEIIEVEFEEEGLFEISLRITKSTDVGELTDSTEVSICVLSDIKASTGIAFFNLETGLPSRNGELLITKSIDVLLDKEGFQTIMIQDGDENEDFTNRMITVETTDRNIFTLSKLSLGNKDNNIVEDDNGNIVGFETSANEDEAISFFIKGITAGKSTIKFTVDKDSREPLVKFVDVNVINAKTNIIARTGGSCEGNGDPDLIFGPNPLSVTFRDQTDTPGFEGTKTTRTWKKDGLEILDDDIQNLSDFQNNDACIELKFETEGAHEITLSHEVSLNVEANMDEDSNNDNAHSIILEASEIIFVQPGEGIGSLSGIVLDSVSKEPIVGAVLQLDGESIPSIDPDSRLFPGFSPNRRLTSLDGGYLFDNLDAKPTKYNLTICAGKAYGCEVTGEISVSAGPNFRNFTLTKITK